MDNDVLIDPSAITIFGNENVSSIAKDEYSPTIFDWEHITEESTLYGLPSDPESTLLTACSGDHQPNDFESLFRNESCPFEGFDSPSVDASILYSRPTMPLHGWTRIIPCSLTGIPVPHTNSRTSPGLFSFSAPQPISPLRQRPNSTEPIAMMRKGSIAPMNSRAMQSRGHQGRLWEPDPKRTRSLKSSNASLDLNLSSQHLVGANVLAMPSDFCDDFPSAGQPFLWQDPASSSNIIPQRLSYNLSSQPYPIENLRKRTIEGHLSCTTDPSCGTSPSTLSTLGSQFEDWTPEITGKDEQPVHESCERFKCPVESCPKGYSRKDHLKRHYMKHDVKLRGSFPLAETTTTLDRRALGTTITQVPERIDFPCPSCFNKYTTRSLLTRHQKEKHDKPTRTYRCAIATCNKKEKKWTRVDNFRAHIKKEHSGTEYDVKEIVRRSEIREGNETQIYPHAQEPHVKIFTFESK